MSAHKKQNKRGSLPATIKVIRAQSARNATTLATDIVLVGDQMRDYKVIRSVFRTNHGDEAHFIFYKCNSGHVIVGVGILPNNQNTWLYAVLRQYTFKAKTNPLFAAYGAMDPYDLAHTLLSQSGITGGVSLAHGSMQDFEIAVAKYVANQ